MIGAYSPTDGIGLIRGLIAVSEFREILADWLVFDELLFKQTYLGSLRVLPTVVGDGRARPALELTTYKLTTCNYRDLSNLVKYKSTKRS